MSALDAMGSVQSRIASIEARIGISSPRGVDIRTSSTLSPGAIDFDRMVRDLTATDSPTATSTGTLADVPHADLFRQAGARHGVDPALLAAVAKAESGFRTDAVSPAGARGLMQLMPATARGLGVTDPFDPAQAIDGAARLLAGHMKTFGSVELALAAYNAGPGAVRTHGGIPPFAETRAYVPKVLAIREELSR